MSTARGPARLRSFPVRTLSAEVGPHMPPINAAPTPPGKPRCSLLLMAPIHYHLDQLMPNPRQTMSRVAASRLGHGDAVVRRL